TKYIGAPMPNTSTTPQAASIADAQKLAEEVRMKSEDKAVEIKNRGRLNKLYYYFIAASGDMPVTGLESELSDDAGQKYFTVAADMIVFSHSLSHVLMVFRCPHDKRGGKKCADNILDNSSFQYKGTLATPGGFFDPRKDVLKLDDKEIPDFKSCAIRELNEECDKLLDEVVEKKPEVHSIGPEFNNFRDIRWFTSTNYVPTLAPQFATVLPAFLEKKEQGFLKRQSWFQHLQRARLPKIKGTDDACGNAYWIDFQIIEAVHKKYQEIYEWFDEPFDDDKFKKFVNEHFVLNDGMPQNKLKKDNSLLQGLGEAEYTVAFDPNADYQFNDFAFDHVKNIVKAHRLLAALVDNRRFLLCDIFYSN
ncbi:hypothetical protein HDU84_007987, partial [Entophlyctis sp. JEL0112]